MTEGEVLWAPTPATRQHSRIGAYLDWLAARGRRFGSYEELWRWSVDDLNGFWTSVWGFFEVGGAPPPQPILGDASMPGFRWGGGATVNYAQHALRPGPDAAAQVVFGSLANGETVAQSVASAQALGVGQSDLNGAVAHLGATERADIVRDTAARVYRPT